MEKYDFEVLYQAYPRKGEGKTRGMQKLKKDIKSDEDYVLLGRAVENIVAIYKRNKTERQYMKMWSTFCNNWRDYINEDELGLPSVKQSAETFKPVVIKR